MKNRSKRRYHHKKKYRHSVPRTQYQYFCIDGNWTNHPVAYCTHYHGVLTEALMKVHGCKDRNCVRLRTDRTYE